MSPVRDETQWNIVLIVLIKLLIHEPFLTVWTFIYETIQWQVKCVLVTKFPVYLLFFLEVISAQFYPSYLWWLGFSFSLPLEPEKSFPHPFPSLLLLLFPSAIIRVMASDVSRGCLLQMTDSLSPFPLLNLKPLQETNSRLLQTTNHKIIISPFFFRRRRTWT